MNKVPWLAACTAFLAAPAYPARPLVTDDTGTQGRGKTQLELGISRSTDRAEGTIERQLGCDAQLSYGLREDLDMAALISCVRHETDDGTTRSTVRGAGDIEMSLKWRFYEQGNVSFALRPGFTLPTGDESKNLGTGRFGYGISLVSSRESESWAFHWQLGYSRNRNKLDERTDIGHVSVAALRDLTARTRVAVDFGAMTNKNKNDSRAPVFLIVGVIHELARDVSVDIGYRDGISSPAVDRSVLAGLTLSF